MPAPTVTLVIPAYREGARLPPLLTALVAEAPAAPSPAVELLVVDDGSGPAERAREEEAVRAAQEALARSGAPHRARFVAAPANRGKGAAIRLGWASADPGAQWLGFLDADGAVSAREAWRLVRLLPALAEVDVLAGTRILMAGRSIRRSALRHLQGRVFATMVEHAFRLGFYDTQCGLKLIRAAALRPLLPRLAEDRWLLDVEVLVLLARGGARLREEPIDWADPGGSKLVPGLDALRMAAGLRRLRRRLDGA
ncbi:glycosyltransferase [Anaeromyxobacter diazotrophicus]|uniref:Dolichol-phosphate mannose synthase n=1 Tax=Anaeromyxobacter diazotrophicus TaxID=2590199 RepID=A0A7I9VHE7_9BACT|nr:glycosyltransferase [Anaeromyxobacter diazotrophicus]GEJ55812.1 dolichol-phosphate mannose synthase [Anaeromyxobacter diazotrophicus]